VIVIAGTRQEALHAGGDNHQPACRAFSLKCCQNIAAVNKTVTVNLLDIRHL